jgi:hypothetical protein
VTNLDRDQSCAAFVASLGTIFLTLAAAAALSAQTSTPPPEIPPRALVRSAVDNEVTGNGSHIKHMFRSQKQTPRGSQTHLYVETDDAMVGRLIAINDRPLTPEQEQGENNHLAWLMNNPDQLRKKNAREKEDAEHTLRIVKALPDAFLYRYAGTQPGTATTGRVGVELVRLNFTPDPSYSPPSRVEQVLVGMEGYLLIDPVEKHIALIDGTLFKDVTFGWGIIGRLDKGGHFRVRQADVGDDSWEITQMNLDITGKILLFKSLRMVSDEVLSDFQRVPDKLSFAQGVALLKTQQEKLAHTAQTAEAKKSP